MWLKFDPKDLINNMTALVEVMVRRQAITWINDGPVRWRIYASLGLDESTAMERRQCKETTGNLEGRVHITGTS